MQLLTGYRRRRSGVHFYGSRVFGLKLYPYKGSIIIREHYLFPDELSEYNRLRPKPKKKGKQRMSDFV